MTVMNMIPAGAGKAKETLLWRHPGYNPADPWADLGSFGSQQITLSDSLDNYSAVKIVYQTNQTTDMNFTAQFDMADPTKYEYSQPARMILAYSNTSNNVYARSARFITDHQHLMWSDCVRQNAAGTANTCALPVEIYGVK